MRFPLITYAVLGVGILVGTSIAQQEPGAGEPPRGDAQRFERLRMRKLAELLELKQEQKQPLFRAFGEMRLAQRRIEQKRQLLLDELSQIVKNNPLDDQALDAKTDQLTALERERIVEREIFIRKVRAILTPVQVAKMALFQERFDAAALRMSREFMHRRGGPGGPGGPPDMPIPEDSLEDRP